MPVSFSPSVNIVRDFDREVNYIPTANSKRVYEQIVNNYRTGIRAFNIIGSFGTGKSAFMLAFEQHLRGIQNYFEPINGQFGSVKQFEFVNIIGEYKSFANAFARHLNIESPDSEHQEEAILSAIENFYQNGAPEKTCIVIVLDEFGKFLEFAASHNPEKELYFIQQLAEFANDADKNILLITVLHQSFDAYAKNLQRTQQQEWEKVKGRLKDIPFNEPVEQLLFLAADRLASKEFQKPIDLDRDITRLLEFVEASRVFPLHTELSYQLAQKLYPFDFLTAAVLTSALQAYGQNERSLFTFLESDDYFGLKYFQNHDMRYNRRRTFYNLCHLHDYLLHNYSSLLRTKNNPHFFHWRAIQNAIYRVESTLTRDIPVAIDLIKTIGLLNIFASAGARIDRRFLADYAQLCLGFENIETVLKALEAKKIIRFLSYKNQYILFEGTDLDIEIEIERAASKIDHDIDLVHEMRKYFHFPYLPAKAVYYKYGTPRFFEFAFSEIPIESLPQQQTDGIINLMINENLSKDEIIAASKNVDEAILYGLYLSAAKIKEILLEIRKIKYVLEKIVDDRVAEKEVRNILEFQEQELNRCVMNNLYTNNGEIVWIFRGQEITIESRSDFNRLLSRICERIYSQTPIFRNELINREKLPSAISIARKNLFEAIMAWGHKQDLGFRADAFPPEKTIYRTLLQQTGIHRNSDSDETHGFQEPTDSSFLPLWRVSEAFLESTKVTRKNLAEFIRILSTKPFKLKRGFIDFWMPLFLFIKREDFALFSEEGFVPVLNLETLDLIYKSPHKFQIKAFELSGIKLDLFNKYRSFTNQSSDQRFSTSSFIEAIKPFLSFYKTLPEYTKHTKRLSKSALNLREAIADATDPEKTFFENFPQALGYSTLNLNESEETLSDYIVQLQNSLREIRGCFDALLDRIESRLLQATGYEGLRFFEYKRELKKRFESLKQHLLLPHQTVFFRQLSSDLDDRRGWLQAIVQVILGKPVEKMRDEEEELLLEKITSAIAELDNLCDIAKLSVDSEKEEVIRIELTSLSKGSRSRLLRLPKQRDQDISALKKKIKALLTEDKNINLTALSQTLQEEISDE